MSRKETVYRQIEIYSQLIEQQEELISTYSKLKSIRNSNDLDHRISAIQLQIESNKKVLERYHHELKSIV